MTLPALDEWVAVGVAGPQYAVGPKCSNPNCNRWAEHAHHILRRSFLAGDFKWVEIDGWVVQNLTGLCPRCHADVTGDVGGHKAAIRINVERREFWWNLVSTPGGVVSYHQSGLLDPQPLALEALAERTSGQTVEVPETCPTCGHARRRRSSSLSEGERRRRKTWNVKVPVDEEDGAYILDTLIENLAPLCPSGDASATGRYYVLVPVLAYATMDVERFVQTMEGVGG